MDQDLPEWENSKVFAPLGILNLQVYHDLKPKDIINGDLFIDGKVFKGVTKLSVSDVLVISELARKNKYLDSEKQELHSLHTNGFFFSCIRST